MDLGLQDKGIIITGGSKGIGFSIAAACAKEGAWVSICGRTQSSLDEAAEKLKVHGGKVHTAVCDIGEADAIAAYVDAAASAVGGLYGLVNNPSGFGNSDNEDGWQKGIDIDLMGVVRTTWAATPHLKANGGGSILNISSISGLAASSNISYGAVKAAVIQLTQSHAKAMAADNIRVNCIAPGSIEFPDGVWDQVKKNMPAMYDATLTGIPFGRMGLPEEVGNVAAFLLSAPAYWTTGQTVAVDGAQSL